MARNIWCTNELENNFAAFPKVINNEVTLKSSSLHTGKGSKMGQKLLIMK